MNELYNTILIVCFTLLLGVPWAYGLFNLTVDNSYSKQANTQIRECQKELPRHQYCVAIISAEVHNND